MLMHTVTAAIQDSVCFHTSHVGKGDCYDLPPGLCCTACQHTEGDLLIVAARPIKLCITPAKFASTLCHQWGDQLIAAAPTWYKACAHSR